MKLICRFDKNGATVCMPNAKLEHIAAFEVDVADSSIAAGDSHCAGILAGLSAGLDLYQSTLLGSMVAAIVVSRLGSDGAPYLHELKHFQKTHFKL